MITTGIERIEDTHCVILDQKYELIKVIGRGGMSVVYLAMDRRLHKNWAIKEIRTRGGLEEESYASQSLIVEAELLKRLDHPALPRIVDVIEENQRLFIVMDYISGISLQTALTEKKRFSESQVLQWFIQLCDVLQYLHAQSPAIIYRDLKPSNLILQSDGRLKLIDFGTAREYKRNVAQDTVILGTDGYAAPEQYGGSQTDERSDIYSLGITIYELLTGIAPNKDAYRFHYHPIRRNFPEISAGMELIVNHCIAFAPIDRYQNCRELEFDLQHPQRVSKTYQKKERRILRWYYSFLIAAAGFALAGAICFSADRFLQNRNYENLLSGILMVESSEAEERCLQAAVLAEGDLRACEILLDIYLQDGSFGQEEEQKLLQCMNISNISAESGGEEYYNLLEKMGELYFYNYHSGDGSFRSRVLKAKPLFQEVCENAPQTAACREPATGYLELCDFCCSYVFDTAGIVEPNQEDYRRLLLSTQNLMGQMVSYESSDAAYVRLTFYRQMVAIVDQYRVGMAYTGITYRELNDWLMKLQEYCDAEQVTRKKNIELQLQVSNDITELRVRIARAFKNTEKVRNI